MGTHVVRGEHHAPVLGRPLVRVRSHSPHALHTPRMEAEGMAGLLHPVLGTPHEHLVVGGHPDDTRASQGVLGCKQPDGNGGYEAAETVTHE
jgi:hypothetical protein